MVKASNRHAHDILEYAKSCLAKDANQCKWVQLAAVRFLRDLKKSKYIWDQDRVNDVCEFVEKLHHIKGRRWAGQKIVLEPWQKFIIGNVFGWVDENGIRRFKVCYVEVPRKNAKSTIAAAIGLYMLVCDGEPGAEVYAIATKREQAKIVSGIAREMANKNADYREYYGVEVNAHNMNQASTGSIFEPLSSDSSTMDGLNTSYASIDELHAHKTRHVFDVVESSTGSREQPVTWLPTTAGSNRAGICYEQRTYVTKVLNRVSVDEEYFGIIYTIDDGDDWTSDMSWRKANPNYGVSVIPEDIARAARKAMTLPSAQNEFLTKRLDVWVNADTAWLDMRALERCIDTDISMEEFEEFECIDAIDLSSKIDMSSRCRLFWEEDDDGVLQVYCFMRRWLPEGTLETAVNDQYYGWEQDGLIQEIPGEIIDIDYIIEDELEASKTYQIEEVAYDPWQASHLAKKLSDKGFDMVEYRHTTQNMSEPMKELEALIVSGRFHYDGDPCLTWMFSNVVCHVDVKGNIYPRKETEANKIDDVIAIIMGVGRLLIKDEVQESVYKSRGIRRL